MRAWSSTSLKLLWFILPLLLIAGFVVVTGPQGSIYNWLSTSHYLYSSSTSTLVSFCIMMKQYYA